MRQSVDRIQVADPATQRALDSLRTAMNEVLAVPVIGGRLLEGVELEGGRTNRIRHGLNRDLRGWEIVRKTAGTTVESFSQVLLLETAIVGSAVGTVTICTDTAGFEEFLLDVRWVHAEAGTVRRLVLEFNAGAITGSGYHRTRSDSSGSATATGNVGAIEESDKDLITLTAFLSAPNGATKHLRATSNGATTPYAGADNQVKAAVTSWNSTTNLTDMRIRSTSTAAAQTTSIAAGSIFRVYGLGTTGAVARTSRIYDAQDENPHPESELWLVSDGLDTETISLWVF